MASQRNQAERSGSAKTKTTRGRANGQRKGQLARNGNKKENGTRYDDGEITKRNARMKLASKTDPLSMCAKLYAIAAVDPWGCPEPPCVPDNVNLPSFKFAARNRGTIQTGAAGSVGFVSVSPYNMVQQNNPSVWSTNTAFTGTATSTGAGVGSNPSDSPFPRTVFVKSSTNVSQTYRIVGAGIRVRYTGPEQFRSGQVICYSAPGNQVIPDGITGPTLLNSRNATTAVCDREWHSVVWKPASPTDLDYFDLDSVNSNANIGRIDDNSGCLLVFVTGVNGNCAFEFEAVTWFEVLGAQLPGLTPSHSDATGLAAVSSARGVVNSSSSISDNVVSFMGATYDALTHMSGIVTPALPALMGFARRLATDALTTSGISLGSTLTLGNW